MTKRHLQWWSVRVVSFLSRPKDVILSMEEVIRHVRKLGPMSSHSGMNCEA